MSKAHYVLIYEDMYGRPKEHDFFTADILKELRAFKPLKKAAQIFSLRRTLAARSPKP